MVQSGSGNSPVEKSADSSSPPPSVVVKHPAVDTPAVLAVGERVREWVRRRLKEILYGW